MKTKMRSVLVVEDNNSSRKMLVKLLREVDDSLLIYDVETAAEAYDVALVYHIDLFIVDIILNTECTGDVSGITFVDRIRKIERYRYSPVIIVSTLEDPKLMAYSELHCYSYLEKPISEERAKRIFKEALKIPQMHQENEYIYFRNDGILYMLEKENIIYIENANRKTTVYTKDDEFQVAYKSCAQLLKELDSENFIQCNRNVVVNKKYIETLDYANRYIGLRGVNRNLDIGITLKKKFKQEMENAI